MSETSSGWWVITLEIATQEAEAMAERLREEYGLEPVELHRPESDHAWLECYFVEKEQARAELERLHLIEGIMGSSLRRCDPRDWSTFWQLHFKPRLVGDRLWLCPEWEKNLPVPPGRKRLWMTPGLSFGTGDHFTTRFCLEMVDHITATTPCHSLWDAGCGSGILGIAGALLGVSRVVGSDFDPLCIPQAQANALKNRVRSRTRWIEDDILSTRVPKGPYDLVCANVFSGLLIQAAEILWSRVGTTLVLSGIREFEVDEVAEAFRNMGAVERVRDGDGEWAGLMFTRH